MSNICLYFQIHQPWRLNNYSLFDIGCHHQYFDTLDDAKYNNEKIIRKVADKSYRPMLKLLLKKITQQPQFCFALSVTGTALEQFIQYTPDIIELLQQLARTQRVEFLAETYYHSLASLYSPAEFRIQVHKHHQKIEKLFGLTPQVFRNTELIYSNNIATQVQTLGYLGMLVEGADKILHGRRPTHIYASPSGLPLLLKHYQLSDDIAFRFSQTAQSQKPLTADTFSHWISSSFSPSEYVNLFMDFETFGEHQWVDTGIFDFFSYFVDRFINTGNNFVMPKEIINTNPQDIFDSEDPVSWADVDRDITAWRGNELQYDTLSVLYSLESKILRTKNQKLLNDWRKLQTSDHFYYMCTKWANDGDVHAYFSPYGSPYDAYIRYNNVLSSLKWRLQHQT